jgi:hypothetical protein
MPDQRTPPSTGSLSADRRHRPDPPAARSLPALQSHPESPSRLSPSTDCFCQESSRTSSSFRTTQASSPWPQRVPAQRVLLAGSTLARAVDQRVLTNRFPVLHTTSHFQSISVTTIKTRLMPHRDNAPSCSHVRCHFHPGSTEGLIRGGVRTVAVCGHGIRTQGTRARPTVSDAVLDRAVEIGD